MIPGHSTASEQHQTDCYESRIKLDFFRRGKFAQIVAANRDRNSHMRAINGQQAEGPTTAPLKTKKGLFRQQFQCFFQLWVLVAREG